MKSCILITYFDDDSVSEAKGLCEAAGCKVLHLIKQRSLNGTKFGLSGGKIDDLKNLVSKMRPDVIVFDEILKPSQNYNLASELKIQIDLYNLNRCPVNQTFNSLLGPDPLMAYDNEFSLTLVDDFATGILNLINDKLKLCHISSNDVIKRTDLADYVIRYSKFGKYMKYKRVKFSQIKYPEPRARLNDLNSSQMSSAPLNQLNRRSS